MEVLAKEITRKEAPRLLKNKTYLDAKAFKNYCESIKINNIIEEYEKTVLSQGDKQKEEKKGHDAPPERGWHDSQDYIDLVKKGIIIQGKLYEIAAKEGSVVTIEHHGIEDVVDFDDKITITYLGDVNRDKTYTLVARELDIEKGECLTHISLNSLRGRTLYGARVCEEVSFPNQQTKAEKIHNIEPKEVKVRVKSIIR